MRTVAKFTMTATLPTAAEATKYWEESKRIVDAWVDDKGEPSEEHNELVIRLRDGRTARFDGDVVEVPGGRLASWSLEEPVAAGEFGTDLLVAINDTHLALYCELRTGSREAIVAPLQLEARAPNFIRALAGQSCEWHCGRTRVATSVRKLKGKEGAAAFLSSLHDQTRDLPLVIVSEHDGFLLHPLLDDDIQRDLCGVALVFKMDEDASWEVSRTAGKGWSCYNGAVRLYWPRLRESDSPFKHPMWTADRLLAAASTTREAAQRVRRALRERVFEVATLTLEEPGIIQDIRQAKLQSMRDADDWETLVDDCAEENKRLREEVKALKNDKKRLQGDIENLELQLAYAPDKGSSAVEQVTKPDVETPPESVADAVEKAREELSDELIFGQDVPGGVQGIAPNAGPPEKILRFLRVLSEMVQEHRKGSLGTSLADWLTKRGCHTTGESETDRNNKDARKRRTWDDGCGSRRYFDLHMKPSEGTSPDRCVRIYFDYDKDRKQAIVAWVGRKPGL